MKDIKGQDLHDLSGTSFHGVASLNTPHTLIVAMVILEVNVKTTLKLY